MSNVLKHMNPEQKEAILHERGPLLVLAGAGSGKTRVLTSRIAHLISEGVDPWRILAITFTNKAANEMKERINLLVGESCAQNIWVSTFHSFCARFLRYEVDSLGLYTRNFVIYDSADSQTLIKNCLKELNLDDKQFPANSIQSTISNAKNALISSEQFALNADNFYSQKVAEVYQLYQTRLRLNNAFDFDDLLMVTIEVLKNEEILEKYQNKFEHILIDEYQDTNQAQYELAKILSQKKKNIFVVGDADQSIYAWRGADIRNIMEFESDFPNARVIKLEQNYRSTQKILDAANAVITNNYNRRDKKLWTENGEGDPISCYQAFNEQDEAKYILESILKLNSIYNIPYNNIAVLYRTNAQSRVIEEWFLKYGISYTMVGGVRFYERKEIKDILAYLRVIFNPNDTLSLLRIINIPKRGIGGTTLKKLVDAANENNVPLFDIISNPGLANGITDRIKKQLEGFSTFIFEMIGLIGQVPITEFIEKVMTDSGYTNYLESENSIEAQTRLENLKELLSVAKGFIEENIIPEDTAVESELEQFLTRVALIA
ncbi:UvrD-helicase domain-containing protein, partial [Selenomonadales bacterium OttesenSCG-928-I06]|nr:UvrD-helicase domain-containing protein [Selenomonadales bacterium OttesenSCG-928-I06]